MSDQAEESQQLPYLPEEVWEKILNNLSSLDDVRNASMTRKDWKRILFPKRDIWLFPQVVPIISNYLTRGDLLKLRQVCKNWKKGVDEFCNSSPHLAPYNARPHIGNDWLQGNTSPYTFYFEWNWESTMDFGKKLQKEDSILGGALYLSDRIDHGSPVDPNCLVQIDASLFGEKVLFLYIECIRDVNWFSSPSSVLKTIRLALETMPNLVSLVIKADFFPHSEDREETSLSCENDYGSITVPHLKTLRLHTNYFTEDKNKHFLETFLIPLYARMLSRLDITNWLPEWSKLFWQNLQDLRLSLHCSFSMCAAFLCSTQIANLKNLEIELRKADDFNVSIYFTLISQFKTLISIKIGTKSCSSTYEFPQVLQYKYFPNIKTLSIITMPLCKSFLKCFPNAKLFSYFAPSHETW